MKIQPVLMCALLLALLPSGGCEKAKTGKPRLGEIERLPRVETVVLGQPTELQVVRSYTAIVEPMEKADLCAMVKGFVSTLPPEMDIGLVVKKGVPLFTLHVPDLVADLGNKKALVEQSVKAEALAAEAIEVAKAEVVEAQAALQRFQGDLDFRKAQYARIAKLTQGDTLSKQQMDEAKLQLDASMASLAAAQAQVATKQGRWKLAQKDSQLAAARVTAARTELAKVEVLVEFATLRSPFDGIITKRWVDSGTMVKDAGTPLFTVMRNDRMRVIFDIPERDVPYLHAGPQGNPVQLVFPCLNGTGATSRLSGTITLLANALDPVTRTMRAEMHVDNKIGDAVGILKPQMTGTASIMLATRSAYSIPSSALLRTGSKMEIFIVASPSGDPSKGVVKRLEVQTGLDTGQRVEIRSETLTGRELVIVRGAGVLRAGDQVIAVPAKQAD